SLPRCQTGKKKGRAPRPHACLSYGAARKDVGLGGEIDLVIDLAEGELAVGGGKGERGVEALYLGVEPLLAIAAIVLDAVFVLPDEDVLLERFDVLVREELSAAIVALGSLGEHLEDDQRIEKNVPLVLGVLRRAADDRRIRIVETSRPLDSDLHV